MLSAFLTKRLRTSAGLRSADSQLLTMTCRPIAPYVWCAKGIYILMGPWVFQSVMPMSWMLLCRCILYIHPTKVTVYTFFWWRSKGVNIDIHYLWVTFNWNVICFLIRIPLCLYNGQPIYSRCHISLNTRHNKLFRFKLRAWQELFGKHSCSNCAIVITIGLEESLQYPLKSVTKNVFNEVKRCYKRSISSASRVTEMHFSSYSRVYSWS